MKTDLYSISKIFTERLLRIPDYQRGYAWTEKQLNDYWNDLIQLEMDKNHYVGVLTVEEAPKEAYSKWESDLWIIESKKYSPLYVVDGQQRLTTTVILIQCICETIGDKGVINYTEVKDVRKKYIFDSKDNGVSRSYLFGYEKDNPSYDFLKSKIFNESDQVEAPLDETIYTQNLINAKQYFLEKLSFFNNEEIEDVYKKITHQFLFAIYSMSDDIDVYITFETMNNRGKPLSHLELLKNRLIYLSTKFNDDSHEKIALRRIVNDCWKAIYHHLGRNKNNPLNDDLFLLNHFLLYFDQESFHYAQITFSHRFNDENDAFFKNYLLEEKFTVKSIHGEKAITIIEVKDYVTSLKASVEIWYQILNPGVSEFDIDIKEWLIKINRLDINSFLPAILKFFLTTKEKNKIIKFLKLIERIVFLSSMTYYPFASLLTHKNRGWIKDGTPDSMIKQLQDAADEAFHNANWLSHWQSMHNDGGFYKWDGIRYFLYEYEQDLLRRSKTHTKKLTWETLVYDDKDFYTVEHIYPRTPKHESWRNTFKAFTAREKNILANSLGNLVPLSMPKNASLGNKPFSEKKSSSKEASIGYRYGCLSENEIAMHEQWSALEILERGIKLTRFMETRWDVKITDHEKFLSLGFVRKKLQY